MRRLAPLTLLWLLLTTPLLAQDSLHFQRVAKPIDLWQTAIDIAELPGGYLALNSGETGLRILERQDGELVEVGHYPVQGEDLFFCMANGAIGYLLSNDGLQSISFANPTQPVQVDYYPILPGTLSPKAMDVQGGKLVLIIGVSGDAFAMYQFELTADGEITPPVRNNTFNGRVTDLVLRDENVFVIQQNLVIYDISEPGIILLISTVPTPPLGDEPTNYEMVLQGDIAWVVGHDQSEEVSWLQAINVSYPLFPSILGQVENYGGHSIAMLGNDAFIVASSPDINSNYLHHFHLSSPTEPEFIETTTEPRHRGKVSVAGGHIYACSQAQGIMDYAFDGDNHLQLVGERSHIGLMAEMQVSDEMILAGLDNSRYFYFPTAAVTGRQVIPVSLADPDTPERLPLLDLGGLGLSWYRDPHLFVCQDSLLTVYDYSSWDEPVEVGQWDENVPLYSSMYHYLDNRLLILPPAFDQTDLRLFDVSDPTDPFRASTIPQTGQGSINLIRWNQYLLFIRDNRWLIYDIANMEEPEVLYDWYFNVNVLATNTPWWRDGNRLYICEDPSEIGIKVHVFEIDLPNAVTHLYTSTVPYPYSSRYFSTWSGHGSYLACQTIRDELFLFDLGQEGVAPLRAETETVELIDLAWVGDRLIALSPYDLEMFEIEGMAGVKDEPLVPRNISLGAAWPNPFNASTMIPFELGQAGEVKVSVHDVMGRLVTTLVEGQRSAGQHRVEWDGRSATGMPVASGSYIVQLEAGGVQASRRILLLK